MGTNLRKELGNILSSDELAMIAGSYDVVGDIAIVEVAKELQHREKIIAETILGSNRKIKVVAKKQGIYGGEYRTIPLQIIGGDNRKETVVKEFGLRYRLNPELVYFSVRSGSERRRVASLVAKGERVVVFFSGIGPYPLIIARYSGTKEIVGIEKNPLAHQYALQNVRLNKLSERVQFYCGDVREEVCQYEQCFDRVIMPLPKMGELFLEQAFKVASPSAVIHFYQMVHRDKITEKRRELEGICEIFGKKVEEIKVIRSGHCAPRTYRVCFDVRFQSTP